MNINSQPIPIIVPLWAKILGVLLLVAAIAIPIIVVLTGKKRKPPGPSPPGPSPPGPSPPGPSPPGPSPPGPSPPGPSPPGPSPPGPSPPGPKVGDSCGAKVNGIQFGVLGIKNLPTEQKIGKKIKSKTYAGLKDCVTFANNNNAVYLGVSTDKTSQVCNIYGNGGTAPTAPTDEYTWKLSNSTKDCGCDVGFAPPAKGTSINDMCNACDSKFTDCVGGDFDGTQDGTVVDPNKKLLQQKGEELCSSQQTDLCCNAEAGACGYGIKSTKDVNYGTLYLAKCGCKKGTTCGVVTSVGDQGSQIDVNCDATTWKSLPYGRNKPVTKYRCCKTDPNCTGDKNKCLFPNGFWVNWGYSLNNDAGVY